MSRLLPIILALTLLSSSGGVVAGVATPGSPMTPASPAGGAVTGPVAGNAFDRLAESASGELSVIAFGPAVIGDDLDFGLVVVNGTDAAVSAVGVTVIVRDRAGVELDTFHDLGFRPDQVEPGGMAIATAVAPEDLVGRDDLSYAFAIEADGPDDQRFFDSPEIVGLERTPDGLSGTLRNPHVGRLDVITLDVVCFDAAGVVSQTASILLVDPLRETGDELPFSLADDPLDDALPCDLFLVAGMGMYIEPE